MYIYININICIIDYELAIIFSNFESDSTLYSQIVHDTINGRTTTIIV